METERRLCPSCLRRDLITSTGDCADCNLTNHLVRTLPRDAVLAGWDEDEFVPPVLEQEYPR